MTHSAEAHLPFWKKLVYGAGEFGPSSIGMMRSLFYAIYLTDTVGLDPRLASLGAIVGLLWDAINDPLVGALSDRVQSRWGRRRPFLLLFSIPFGASFILLWSAPSWDNQIALLVFVTLSFMLVDTLGTLITVPYLSLFPELAPGYDERTSLAGFRTAFQLIASLAVVIVAPMLIDAALAAGLTQREGYMMAGAIFGAMCAILFLVIFLCIPEKPNTTKSENLPIRKALRLAWSNIPFRFVVVVYLLNWTALDMVAVVFPFYLLYWIAQGHLLAKASIFGLPLTLESAFFGLLMLVCMLCVPFWLWLAHRRNKRDAYVAGMGFFLLMLALIFFIQPGQMNLLLILGGLAGFSIAAAYVLPDAMFPDIIEWDELRARRRQEGIYYGARAFIRKLTTAFVIFVTLQLLGWSGYRTPPPEAVHFAQPQSALLMIRLLITVGAGLMVSIAALTAWINPMTREKNARIRLLLDRREQRSLQEE
jgi:GPH family glycoside/pentoside/hexuronide:cation symporter